MYGHQHCGKKNIFEKINLTHINALTNISERALGYCRKGLNEASQKLTEAVSELWKGRVVDKA